MVNLTALERISRFIRNDNRIKKMKPWSQRFRFDSMDKSCPYLRKLKKQVFELLSLISDDEISEMLRGFKSSVFIQFILQRLLFKIFLRKSI